MNKELVTLRASEIKPYENNPRLNDAAVGQVAESIKQVGYISPIVVDEDGVILAGHTRYKALIAQGVEEISVIRISGLSERKKKKFRILDNKTGEAAGWDFDKLGEELEGLDFEGFDFGFGVPDDIEDVFEETEKKYTDKVDTIQYTPGDEVVRVSDMYDAEKRDSLVREIEQTSDIDDDLRAFLIEAANRHVVFNYAKIADCYAKQPSIIQALFERSGLVIIDYDDAIRDGYVKISEAIGDDET